MKNLLLLELEKQRHCGLPIGNSDGAPLDSWSLISDCIFSDLEELFRGGSLGYTFDDVAGTCTDLPRLAVAMGWMEFDRSDIAPEQTRESFEAGCKYFLITRKGRSIYRSQVGEDFKDRLAHKFSITEFIQFMDRNATGTP